MKKGLRIMVIIAIVFALAAGQLAGPDLQAAADDTVKIDMKVGFDKFYKIGYTTPVYFEIENGLRDINGELQIEMPNRSDSITLYAMNVSLPKGSVKKFLMNVPMNVFNTKLNVKLAEGKNIVAEKTFRVDPGSNGETYAIGILSDDFDSVKYINKITVRSAGNPGTRNVRLDEASFPEELEVLKTFNVIVINNFDTSKLSGPQYEALKKWVYGGGVLIIGTGPSLGKTLAVFRDDFITGEIGEARTIRTESLHRIAESKTPEAMNISVSDISLKESVPVVRDGDIILLQKLEKGKGIVGAAAFDFGMEPLSTWIGNSTFADKLIVSLLPQYYISDIYMKGKMAYENVYAIDNALKNIPELPMPKASHMIFLYAAYILLAAPVSYFILKRMDKRELMWITVPVLSIVFTGAVYLSGAGTRLTEPVTNIISLVDIDNSGKITPRTYAGVFTPQKNSIRIEAEGGSDVRPLGTNNYYYRGPVDNDNTPKTIDSKVILSPGAALEFYKTGIWSMKTLTVETEKTLSGKLESKLNYAKGAFTGTITNTSGFDLEECYLVTPNQYADIGPLKNGETKQVNVKPGNYYGQRYDLINAIYKDPYSSSQSRGQKKKLTSEEITQLKKNNQKRQVLEYGLLNEGGIGFEATLIAWSSTPVSGELLVNGRSTKKYEKSFITAKADMSFREGNNIEYPLGFLKPTIVNSQNTANYDEYGKTFYGRGSFEIHYGIDGNIELESVSIQFTVRDKQRVKQYIWDNEKGDWAEGDYSSYEIYGSRLKSYIDGSNLLKLKFEIEDESVQLPQIAVKGSVR